MQVVPARHGRIIRLLRLHGSVEVSALAVQLGVSAMTIRRDLALLAEQGLVERVYGGAVLRPPAQQGRLDGSGRRQALRFAMLTPGLGYYYGKVLRGAEAGAAEHGVQLVYVEHHYEPQLESQVLERIAALDADGLILSTSQWPTELSEKVLGQLQQLSAPIVLCERSGSRGVLAEHDQVASDHGYGMLLGLRHLADLGHRRITWVSRAGHIESSRERALAWAKEHMDIDVNDLGGAYPGPYAEHAAAARQIIASLREHGSTALICHNDQDTLSLIPALRAAGIWIPQDLSLVSSDDEQVARASVPVTAISPPKFEIGRRAVELLYRRVTGSGTEQPIEHLWLLPSLVVRSSTAPLRRSN